MKTLILGLLLICALPSCTGKNKEQQQELTISEIGQGDSESCICVEVYAPVCGSDGKTYANDCHADCAGVTIAAQGECQSHQ